MLPARWRAAYDAHPRHLFLPDRVWVTLDEPLDRAAEPDRRLAYVYSDDSIITQLHNGAVCSERGYPISSSCSMPAVVSPCWGRPSASRGSWSRTRSASATMPRAMTVCCAVTA